MTDRSTMRILYTEHAESRMDFRKISKAEVEQAISQPYFTIPFRFGRQVTVKKKGDKYLKVIYESNDKITVVTVYWTRRP